MSTSTAASGVIRSPADVNGGDGETAIQALRGRPKPDLAVLLRIARMALRYR